MSELLDNYRRTGEWTCDVVAGVRDLDAPTPCEEWRMRDLLNHMLDAQRYFLSVARGEDGTLPGPNPPDLLTDSPYDDFKRMTSDVASAYAQDGVVEKTGLLLGIAFGDLLVHAWDVARASGQDSTMPAGLPDAMYAVVSEQLTDDRRQGMFKPAVAVGSDATAQERLLAFLGRNPD